MPLDCLPQDQGPRHYHAIWLSDIHLGTRGCKAEFLLDFLRSTESEYLYLVGDIIDGWQLRRSWYWTQAHNDVIQKLLRKARKGTHVVYIPGNHDEFARDYIDQMFGGIAVCENAIHEMIDGRKLLRLLQDGDLRERLGREAVEYARQWSAQKMAVRLIGLYTGVLQGDRAASSVPARDASATG